MRTWEDRYPTTPPLFVNVNVSGKQLTHPSMFETLKKVLSQTGLAPTSLRLEITENILMEYAGQVKMVLEQLVAYGVEVEIDDFGTGYSSLAYIQHFPISTIKIDRSFVSRLGDSSAKAEIVNTIINLTRELGISAVAEGIETSSQLSHLKKIQCPYGQGYLLAKPLDQQTIENLILEKRKQAPASSSA